MRHALENDPISATSIDKWLLRRPIDEVLHSEPLVESGDTPGLTEARRLGNPLLKERRPPDCSLASDLRCRYMEPNGLVGKIEAALLLSEFVMERHGDFGAAGMLPRATEFVAENLSTVAATWIARWAASAVSISFD